MIREKQLRLKQFFPFLACTLLAFFRPFPANAAASLDTYLLLLKHPALHVQFPQQYAETQSLLRNIAPKIFLHPLERYAPADPIDDYTQLLAQPSMKKSSDPVLLWHFSASPIIEKISTQQTKKNWVLIEFWYYTPFNDAEFWFGIGDHDGDWEGAALLLEPSLDPSGQLMAHVAAAYYSQHNSGTWYCTQELEWTGKTLGTGRPVIYSARGSHANFPAVGRHPRFFNLFGTDNTERGPVYEGWRNLRPLALEPYYEFRGPWGKVSSIPFSSAPQSPHPSSKYLPQSADSGDIEEMLAVLRGKSGFDVCVSCPLNCGK